ncbi:anti-phage defense-associated sirtuin Dsr1 [Mesorhizobium hawassense]|uniref:anti-phage defense-associated sirtuin Dsr1 n=1 Tax=Mesorhizobium hawassense TaxID=1209954 RepID=UPI00142E0A8B|nr:anti-phage defense-associated sirtuin Dsr1 [Mesorhizobium hawassense]
MQFVKDGPDIPELLLQAHEDGRVVFFCGAGISYPAGLPGFAGLVQKIYSEIGESPNEVEQTALKANLYDTAISLLENRVVGNRNTVRAALARVLTPDLALSNATTTHEALITLSKTLKGQFRLITTNFDQLFEEAKSRLNTNFQEFSAPLLPVPKRKWDGLVYLHGLLPKIATSAALDRLVVSSGDFGLAYLTERWAARFVGELFRNYTICFVGYSLNDPVLRYMMDALAADRLLGEAPLEVFAFGSYTKGQEAQITNEWRAKNVTPILYRSRNRRDHAHLHETLRVWAGTYRDGTRGKEAIVARHANAKPTGSTRQDDFVGRLLWAISDSTGLPARHFAEFTPLPPLDWLFAFAENRFHQSDLIRFGVRANEVEDEKLTYSLVARPAPYTHSPWMTLVHRTSRNISSWDPVMIQLGRWLARHVPDPRLLVWVAQNGGHLDNRFGYFVSEALASNPPPQLIESLWLFALAGRLQDITGRFDLYDWCRRFSKTGMSPILRLELREILAPRLKLREGYQWQDNEVESRTEVERIESAISWEIVLGAEFVRSALDPMNSNERWQAEMPMLLADFTQLLRDALDIMRQLGGAGPHSDRSHWYQPSIQPHPQNTRFRDWTVLIELVRDAWVETAHSTPDRAHHEVLAWLNIDYPLFKRLAFFAATEQRNLFPTSQVIGWLLSDAQWWLWATETQHEVLRLLASLGPDVTAVEAEALQTAILNGLPEEMKGTADAEQVRLIQDREIWRRLSILSTAGCALTPAASQKLDDILQEHPGWGRVEERDEFPVWMSSDGSWRRFSTTPKSRRELETWLQENPNVDDLHQEDDFRERCQTDFPRTLVALVNLARRNIWIVDRWHQALNAWSDDSRARRAWRCLHVPLAEAPDYVMEALARPIAQLLKACAKTVGPTADAFFVLADRVVEASRDESRESSNDILISAINHPIGYVTEAVLDWWYAGGLEDNQKISGRIRELLSKLSDLNVNSFRHARIIIATHAITFFRVDKEWADTYVLPLFCWERPEIALNAWTGFLWSPRLYWPLLIALQEPFIATAQHYDDLQQVGDQYVALLTFAALDRAPSFKASKFSAAISVLPPAGLARAAQALTDALQGAGERRPEYWENRIKPFLKSIWPKSQQLRSAAIAEKFAELLVASGEAFADALRVLGDWLMPFEGSGYVLGRLAEAGLSSSFPNESLEFMSRIVPAQGLWSRDELRNNLVVIRAANPALVDDLRFIRLETLIRQLGISLD